MIGWRISASMALVAGVMACGSSGTSTLGDGGVDGGAGASGSSGGGAGGASGGGAGGVGGTTSTDCESAAEAKPADPGTPGTVSGVNGAFTDECTPDGNLVEYLCETMQECDQPPNPACTTVLTGEVVSREFDCNGGCVGGACEDRCPEFGDQLTYLSVDAQGNVELRNETDGRKYSCELAFDMGGCTGKMAGETTIISALGLRGEPCTGGEFGNIGTGEPQQCSYVCTLID